MSVGTSSNGSIDKLGAVGGSEVETGSPTVASVKAYLNDKAGKEFTREVAGCAEGNGQCCLPAFLVALFLRTSSSIAHPVPLHF